MPTITSVLPALPAVDPLPYDDPVVALLTERYGPLMQHSAVAKLLGRHPTGLRDMLGRRPQEPTYAILRAARRPCGRHTLYDVRIVGRLIASPEARP